MASPNDIKNGMTIIFNGQVHQVVEFQHVKPGKGAAFVRTRLKNLRTGQVLDQIFKARDEVELAMIERHVAQFLYKTPTSLVFMDTNTYEQVEVALEPHKHLLAYMKENEEVTTTVYEGEVIDIALPFTAELRVTHAAPGVKGDTATGATKSVTVETGATIQVPLFINEGDVIKVDTRTGNYLTRA